MADKPAWRTGAQVPAGQERDRKVRRVILIEGLANLVVLLAKAAIGLSTGSLAILGDALHSLTDLANNVVAWAIVRLSSQPPDREHPYGHRKFETLAVFGLAGLLAVLSIELALGALRREHHEGVGDSGWGLGIMVAVLLINIVVTIWQRHWARRLDSPILWADASHTLVDVLVTTAVIAGWQLSAHGYPWVDTICALGVAAFVLYLAYGLFRDVVPVLVDEIAVEPEALREAVRKVPGVHQVRRVRSRWVGTEREVDLVIAVEPSLTTEASHAIADRVEDVVSEKFEVKDVSVHIEPDHGRQRTEPPKRKR